MRAEFKNSKSRLEQEFNNFCPMLLLTLLTICRSKIFVLLHSLQMDHRSDTDHASGGRRGGVGGPSPTRGASRTRGAGEGEKVTQVQPSHKPVASPVVFVLIHPFWCLVIFGSSRQQFRKTVASGVGFGYRSIRVHSVLWCRVCIVSNRERQVG